MTLEIETTQWGNPWQPMGMPHQVCQSQCLTNPQPTLKEQLMLDVNLTSLPLVPSRLDL